MPHRIGAYFSALSAQFGQGWNRFWFTPSDAATLSALRIATGLMALYLQLTYGYDLERFFGAGGMLTPGAVGEWASYFVDWPQWVSRMVDPPDSLNRLSYLNYISSPTGLWTAHLIGAGVLVLFTLGFKTRITSVLALIVSLAYFHRAPMLTSQVEPVIAMLQFYLCLGPCGAYWSIDDWLARRKAAAQPDLTQRQPQGPDPRPSSWATVSQRLIQVHLAAFFVMSVLSKLGSGAASPVWWTGEAMWWIVARPESRLVDFSWLAHYPAVIAIWTHSVVLYELSFPLLAWNRLARPLLLFVGVLIWASLALASGLTTYCLTMAFATFAFVPGHTLRSWLSCCGPQRAEATRELAKPVTV